jgi:hypothetical protein
MFVADPHLSPLAVIGFGLPFTLTSCQLNRVETNIEGMRCEVVK